MNSNKSLFVTLEPDLKDWLNNQAAEHGLSLSAYCRMILIRHRNEETKTSGGKDE